MVHREVIRHNLDVHRVLRPIAIAALLVPVACGEAATGITGKWRHAAAKGRVDEFRADGTWHVYNVGGRIGGGTWTATGNEVTLVLVPDEEPKRYVHRFTVLDDELRFVLPDGTFYVYYRVGSERERKYYEDR